MDSDADFLTATMARVYAGQGYYDKAAEIYRHLLSQSPDRRDLADTLAKVEKLIDAHRPPDQDRLVALFIHWFELAAGCGRIAQLKRLSQDILGDR